ncbi:MAG: ParB/RepB/Spo0J family partition protein [Saprospiraceae bacterium]|nr:ParB/RepB/Spo0J family partition protein [Saprospiraceae bacterium]
MSKVDKKELGKGIRALLGNANAPAVKEKSKSPIDYVTEVPVNLIEANPFQPRNEFDLSELEELADSIKTFGLIQPVTLRKLSADAYQLIAGERRLRACKMAGLDIIPAYVRKANDQEMLEMALVENIQRTDLNAIEVAITYQRLIDECDLTHEAMSDRVGKKRSTVTNYLRLLKLPPLAQQALKLEKISMGHARAILGLTNQEEQLQALQTILEKDMSVRAAERLVKYYSTPSSRNVEKKRLPANYQQVVDHLSKWLGAKVDMKRSSKGKGSLTINFASDDELNRILDTMEGN